MSRKEAIVEVARRAGRAQARGLQPGARGTSHDPTARAFRHDGLTFDVRDEGPLDGDPVVLLHGFPERSDLLARRRAAAARRGPAHLRARPARLLAGRPAAAAPRLHDAQARRRRRRADREDRRPGAPGRPRLGRGRRLGWSPLHRPDLVRTWTAVSVPHPAAFARAMLTTTPAAAVLVHGRLPASRCCPSWRAARPGGRFDRSMRSGGMTARRRRAVPPRDRRRTARCRARWTGTARCRSPSRARPPHQVTVPTTFVWSDGDVAIDAGSRSTHCADWVDRAVRAGRPRGRQPLDPDPGARGAGRAILDADRVAA